MRSRCVVHGPGKLASLVREVPAGTALLHQARAARRRGHGKPTIRDGRVRAHQVAGLAARAAIAAVRKVDDKDERRAIDPQLLGLLERKGELRATPLEELREQWRDLGRIRRIHALIVPGLAPAPRPRRSTAFPERARDARPVSACRR